MAMNSIQYSANCRFCLLNIMWKGMTRINSPFSAILMNNIVTYVWTCLLVHICKNFRKHINMQKQTGWATEFAYLPFYWIIPNYFSKIAVWLFLHAGSHILLWNFIPENRFIFTNEVECLLMFIKLKVFLFCEPIAYVFVHFSIKLVAFLAYSE